MAKKFLILSRARAEQYCPQVPHVAISVRDPNSYKARLPKNRERLAALYLSFDDLDFRPDSVGDRKVVLFNTKQAKRILKFYEQWREQVSVFIINCEAGISRSAAIGAALCKISGQTDTDFFRNYLPNRFIYRKILGAKYGGYEETEKDKN